MENSCVYVHACVHVLVEDKGKLQEFPRSNTLRFLCLGLSLAWELLGWLGWLAAELEGHLSLSPYHWHYKHAQQHPTPSSLCGFWGSKSDLHTFMASTL